MTIDEYREPTDADIGKKCEVSDRWMEHYLDGDFAGTFAFNGVTYFAADRGTHPPSLWELCRIKKEQTK